MKNPEELWSAFKTTILDVAVRCLGTDQRAKKNFVSQGTLDTIDQSCMARLNCRAELFTELRNKTARALSVDKETYVQEICEEVEHQVNLVLLTGEFTYCVPPNPSLCGLLLEQRVVSS